MGKMTWAEFIKLCKERNVTPDKLSGFVKQQSGPKNQSDTQKLKRWWVNCLINYFKTYHGVPKNVDKKKLNNQQRIRYITRSAGYELQWRLFNFKKVKEPINGKLVTVYAESSISKKEFNSIKHEQNITRLLQRHKVIK
jgi:hypothetical protein